MINLTNSSATPGKKRQYYSTGNKIINSCSGYDTVRLVFQLVGDGVAWSGSSCLWLAHLPHAWPHAADFGGYCLVNGILTLVAAFRRARDQARWWALALEGVASLVAGGVTLFWPGLTSLALLYVVAAWALITGLLQIGTAIRLRKQITGEWVLIASGLMSVVFGLFLVFMPLTGALVVAWWIGAYAFAFGILLVILAFRLRRRTARPASAHAMGPERPATL
jgi:uncharacterized membrane protein HdeD (DUF308 family)